MSTVSLSSHAGRLPPSLVSSSGVLATSPTSLRSPSTFTTVTASGHIPLQPSNVPLLHSLLDSPDYRQAMHSNPELARGSSRRHSKVVNEQAKAALPRVSSSFSAGGSSSRAPASKSLAFGSSVAGSVRRTQPATNVGAVSNRQSGEVQDSQKRGRRTLPPQPKLPAPTTAANPSVSPVSPAIRPTSVARSSTMFTSLPATTSNSRCAPTCSSYPSRSFSQDVSHAKSPYHSSFRDAIDKLRRMLRRSNRRRCVRSGTVTSVDTLPSSSSMLELADARSSRTSLMSGLSRLGDVAYVDVVAELERVEPDSTPQTLATTAAKPSRWSLARSPPLLPSNATDRLTARAPAPSCAAQTTDVEAWRETRRQFLLVLQEGPPIAASGSASPSNSRRLYSTKPSHPSLFKRRRPSFPSFSRWHATVTPFSLERRVAPLERSRTLDESGTPLDPATAGANRRYSTYGSRWLDGTELVEGLSRPSGSMQVQEDKGGGGSGVGGSRNERKRTADAARRARRASCSL